MHLDSNVFDKRRVRFVAGINKNRSAVETIIAIIVETNNRPGIKEALQI